jgi:hypothetical protein
MSSFSSFRETRYWHPGEVQIEALLEPLFAVAEPFEPPVGTIRRLVAAAAELRELLEVLEPHRRASASITSSGGVDVNVTRETPIAALRRLAATVPIDVPKYDPAPCARCSGAPCVCAEFDVPPFDVGDVVCIAAIDGPAMMVAALPDPKALRRDRKWHFLWFAADRSLEVASFADSFVRASVVRVAVPPARDTKLALVRWTRSDGRELYLLDRHPLGGDASLWTEQPDEGRRMSRREACDAARELRAGECGRDGRINAILALPFGALIVDERELGR